MMNTQTESICRNELGMLAKLLATEDVFVEHKNVSTASFDTKNRVLTLPMWSKISHNLYHMLVLHEIGHALWTNADDWKNAVTEYPNLAGIINVIEDARIERMVKDKYPGSRRDFRIGYNELVQRNFFKIDPTQLNDLSLADRINLYYKIGDHFKIPFSNSEMAIIREIDNLRTFAQVVELAKRLGDLTKKREENLQSKGGDNSEQNDNGEKMPATDPKSGSGEASPESNVEQFDSNSDSGAQEIVSRDNQGSKPSDRTDDANNGNSKMDDLSLDKDDLETETVEALADAITKIVDPNAISNQYYIAKYRKDWKRWVISYKEVLDTLALDRPHHIVAQAGQFQKTRRAAVRMVDYLIKEFEVRKAADEYVRTREAKSGVINPNRLHAYRMSDDIFRRVNIRPDAKNHSIMMFIDFSGSMNGNMSDTIDQLMNLVLFCRKANIPHRVYAFSDMFPSLTGVKSEPAKWNSGIMKIEYTKETLSPDNSMRLIELFHESMTSNEFRQIIDHLKVRFGKQGNQHNHTDSWNAYRPKLFCLGGTPLDCAMLLARPMLHEFKRETRTQLVSCVFLTDGGSGGISIDRDNFTQTVMPNPSTAVIVDPIKRKNYSLNAFKRSLGPRECVTEVLTEMIRSDGFRTVNFYVTDSGYEFRKICYSQGTSHADSKELLREFKKNGSYTFDDILGFDQYYVIMSSNEDPDDDGEFSFDVENGSKKSTIARAFINARNSRLDARVVLKNFIKKIAA